MATLHRLMALAVSLLFLAGLLGSAPALAQDKALLPWEQIDKLVDEGNNEQAAQASEARLAQARGKADENEWARALIRTVQLRKRLRMYETAVRFLKDEPWPKSLLPRTAVQLFYAHLLSNYTRMYGWEVGQREHVVSTGPVDLKVWTQEQILAEAHNTFLEIWKNREQLGTASNKALSGFIFPNTYPEGIRPTLRDAVAYLWVKQLADTSMWPAGQAQAAYQLDLGKLLEGASEAELMDPASHPVVKIAAILGDLEAWHRSAGQHEAELEARLTRFERFSYIFTQDDDRALIRQRLAASLEGFHNVPWWAMGQALLARMEKDADLGIRAYESARRGAAAYPLSLGAERCTALINELRAATFSVAAMSSDGAYRRSIEVTHRNVRALYFRAYPYDLEKRLAQAGDYNLMPDGGDLRKVLLKQTPLLSWTLALPATPDFQDHRTFVTPELSKPGTYLIVASAWEDFREDRNSVQAVFLTVTHYVIVARSDALRRLELRVVDGDTGQPVARVEARMLLNEYLRGHKELRHAFTDAQGEVSLSSQPHDGYESFLVVLGRGKDALLLQDPLGIYSGTERLPPSQTLVFTDRSVYRPLQKILWKVVAFQGTSGPERYKTQPNRKVTVALRDANNQVVEKRQVLTNAFGSAAGEFSIPAGRLLGGWRVTTDPQGSASVRVEEYKRPTFEVLVKDQASALRLNRPASIQGEARYYFGLPVTSGAVRWRVFREPIFPDWWWFGGYRGRASSDGRQPVATGTATLTADGTFTISFTPEADEREAKSPSVTWRYRVEADVTDEGGETRSVDKAFRLGFTSVEARVDAAQGFFEEGKPGALRLVRSNLDGAPQTGQGSWRLVALRQPAQPLLPAEVPIEPPPGQPLEGGPERISTPGDRLQPRWTEEYSPGRTLRRWADGAELTKGSVEHDAQGMGEVKLPALEPGAYRLRYETVDGFGQKFTLAHELIVAGKSLPVALPAMLQLERSTVKVGETARMLAFTGFEGQLLYLDVYQGDKRLERHQLVGGQSPVVFEVPVTEQLRGGFSVALVGVRDYQLLRFTEPVFVPFDNKDLSLEFSTFRDKLRPGDKETWRVTVRGAKGAKVEAGTAELLAYMYDQSLDIFAQHTPPSPRTLYPTGVETVGLTSSLRGGQGTWIHGDGRLGWVPGWSAPQEDFLLGLDFYGEGQPGERRLEKKRMEIIQIIKGSSVTGADVAKRSAEPSRASTPPPPPPPPPPSQAMSAGQDSVPQPLRSNFSETAFWIPQLLTDADGSAALEFTVPDSVTAWSAWVHAVTKDLKGGSVQRTSRSVKELMVRPYVPRFLREGDQAVLEVMINNAGTQPLEGTLTLDIVDPEEDKSVLSRFGVTQPSQPFKVEAGKGSSLRFALSAPAKVGPVAFRVTARSGNLSDGELRPLPVLPGRMHLSQSRFVTLRGKDRKELTFEDLRRNDDPSRINEQLAVTVDAQLFYSVLQALPYLVEYPYECTEQTLNRFLSTGIVSSLYRQYPAVAKMAKTLSARPTRFETWESADPNRKMALEESPWLQEAQGGAAEDQRLLRVLDPVVASAQSEASLAKLQKAQTSGGGFPWWQGGPPSPYMTLYIVHGLARASQYKVDFPRYMTQQAWGYLALHFREEYASKLMKEDGGWEFLTFLNYVASSYPDAGYTGSGLTEEERKRILDFSFKHWKQHSPYLKAYLALTLKRAGRTKDAELVWESVMDAAKTSPELGTSFAPEERSWLWYNDTTETQALVLSTLTELKPRDPRRDGLVQWLLLDKKLNHWKSTRATAEALYALVKYLEQEGALGIREDAKVTVGDKTVEFVFEPDKYTGKKNQVVLKGPEVDPVKSSTVVVEKTSKGFAFASATWQFSTEKLPTEDRGDFFHVSRRYFVRSTEGTQAQLKPLAEGAKLAPGDEVEVQLSLRTQHEAEYVHLRDPRAAGLEPENAVSRYKWDLGISWYEETRDSGTNFFFEWLPAGEYTFKYRLRANMAGTFRVGPATIQSMYAPEFTAYSTGAVLTVGSAHP